MEGLRREDPTDTQVTCAMPERRLPTDLTNIVDHFERATTLAGAVAELERALVTWLGLKNVLVVWMDWPRRIAWSAAGPLSSRLQELVPEVAGSGRRGVLANAILEPLGAAPARAVLVMRGSPELLFRPHTLRLIPRVAARIAPVLARLITAR